MEKTCHRNHIAQKERDKDPKGLKSQEITRFKESKVVFASGIKKRKLLVQKE